MVGDAEDKGSGVLEKGEGKRRTLPWPLKWHYACTCGWYTRKDKLVGEPKKCPACGRTAKEAGV